METIELHGNVYSKNCPTRQVLNRIGDKWTALVIGLLEEGPMRFSEFRQRIGGISQKMLTQTLRHLERDGLVKRTAYLEIPPRVEYELTALGETLCVPLSVIRHWSEENIMEITAAQEAYDTQKVKKAKVNGL